MLPQNALSQAHKMKIRWFVTLSAVPLLGVITAFGIMPQSEISSSAQKTVIESITLPALAPTNTNSGVFWRNDRVQRGETVAELLRRLNVEDANATDYILKNQAALPLRKLAVGKEIQSEVALDGSLLALRFLSNEGKQVVIERSGGAYKTTVSSVQMEQRVMIRTGEIKTSLYAATDAAGLTEPITRQMIDIFSGDVDFHRDLHKGDKFTVVYEMTYSNGEAVRSGRILGAEFVNQGHAYRTLYFKTSATTGDYYTPEGKSMRKAFLRSPIEFSRVSSGFTNARFHPVLNTWRAHKGVDYAAPMGTSVKVTADGTVALVGKQSGYGNVVVISHQGRYSTVYGHLSRFANLHRGQHVHQGDVIGFVGMTGLATGPHLHYEFKIDGVQRDPLRVALPNTSPISDGQKTAFEDATRELNDRLGMLHTAKLAKLD